MVDRKKGNWACVTPKKGRILRNINIQQILQILNNIIEIS